MFTSRSIIFALISFLAGANACVQCPATLNTNSRVMKLHNTLPDVSFTACVYDINNSGGPTVSCQYDNDDGELVYGFQSCPRAVIASKGRCL
ncbi:uncharacterized protein EDB91DRAFT_1132453, partial [Suillus paluster]|uniref:uncharacterized protein n=1 Tax=Suillus paluster TaxID=48578 RepID=UPI001B873098